MSLQERMWREIPEETARIARTIYPKGNLFMQIRDELGELFSDADFADLYPRKGQGGISPSLLASVLVMQSLADYSDRQAAEAVRDQISWKYALGLELDAPGFDYSVLSEFRQRLVEAGAHERLFQPVLEKLAAKGLLKGRGKQRTDA
ncbi:MAG: transposase, partial [Anaerolineae bacterium]|nr:transposase [Anaerolineae bacterium]